MVASSNCLSMALFFSVNPGEAAPRRFLISIMNLISSSTLRSQWMAIPMRALQRQRRKEVGIRRVLAASVGTVVMLLSRDFLKLVVIANLVAWPVAYFVVDTWLQGFAYRVDVGFTPFLLAGLAAFVNLLNDRANGYARQLLIPRLDYLPNTGRTDLAHLIATVFLPAAMKRYGYAEEAETIRSVEDENLGDGFRILASRFVRLGRAMRRWRLRCGCVTCRRLRPRSKIALGRLSVLSCGLPFRAAHPGESAEQPVYHR